MTRTVLISMPFMGADRPSIQLGLLKAIAQAHGHPVRTLHANLDFAARIGADLYDALAQHRGALLGDWVFSLAAFGTAAPDPDGLLLEELPGDLVPGGHDRLLRLREIDVPDYLDALLNAVPWQDVDVVGFTSTFQQNTASFALARLLKESFPGIVTVFGGANLDGGMGVEVVRSVPCVDLAITGEADTSFPRLLAALDHGLPGRDLAEIPGLVRRVGGAVVAVPPAAPFADLDVLPPPDYDEYFERAEDLGLLPRAAHRRVLIPFEAARGCWWGERHHCTFCGLNGQTMGFRSKSPDRVLGELAHQARRYRSFDFCAVDNILDPRYLRDLFPRLSGTDYSLFFEVKANLTRDQLGVLARAGVTRIQPGLESLSTPVLGLMRKGVRAGQNVNLLRWARYHGIEVSWNLLWGFPGESAEDYARQAEAVPHLVHLPPPESTGRIWLERFSPMFTGPDAFSIGFRAPDPSYRRVYPAHVDLDEIAYFFDYRLTDPLPPSVYAPLSSAVGAWTAAWEQADPPVLTSWSAPGFLQIYDGRHAGREGTYTFHSPLAEIYLACSDRPMSASAVRERLSTDVPVETVTEAFEEFARRGLMFLDGSRALALALPATAGH